MENKQNKTHTTGKLIENKDFILWLSNYPSGDRAMAIKSAIFNVLKDIGVKENDTLKAALTQISLCCKVQLKRLPHNIQSSRVRLKRTSSEELLYNKLKFNVNKTHLTNNGDEKSPKQIRKNSLENVNIQEEHDLLTSKNATPIIKNVNKKSDYIIDDSSSKIIEKDNCTTVMNQSKNKRKIDYKVNILSKRSKNKDEIKSSRRSSVVNTKEDLGNCRALLPESNSSESEDDCMIVSVTFPNTPTSSSVPCTEQGVQDASVESPRNCSLTVGDEDTKKQNEVGKGQTYSLEPTSSELSKNDETKQLLSTVSALKEKNTEKIKGFKKQIEESFDKKKTNKRVRQNKKRTCKKETSVKRSSKIKSIADVSGNGNNIHSKHLISDNNCVAKENSEIDEDSDTLHIAEDEPTPNVGKIRIRDISTLLAKSDSSICSETELPDGASKNTNVEAKVPPKVPRYLLETFCKEDVQFMKLFASLFNELVDSKIEIMGNILHLGIIEFICKVERMQWAEKLSSAITISAEKERLEKDFRDNMRQRGIEFSALFGSIVSKFDEACVLELFMALYVKLEFVLLKLYFNSHNHLHLAKIILNLMLCRNNYKNETIMRILSGDCKKEFDSLYSRISSLVKFCSSFYVTDDGKLQKFNPDELERQQTEANIIVAVTKILPVHKSIIKNVNNLVAPQHSISSLSLNAANVSNCNLSVLQEQSNVSQGVVSKSNVNNVIYLNNSGLCNEVRIDITAGLNTSMEVPVATSDGIHFLKSGTNTPKSDLSSSILQPHVPSNFGPVINIPDQIPSAYKQLRVDECPSIRFAVGDNFSPAVSLNQNLFVFATTPQPVSNVGQMITTSPNVNVPIVMVSAASTNSPVMYRRVVQNQ